MFDNNVFAFVWPQIRENNFNEENLLSCSLKENAKPCRVNFRLKIQVPSAVSELTLSGYNCLICYKCSDHRVGKILFVVSRLLVTKTADRER